MKTIFTIFVILTTIHQNLCFSNTIYDIVAKTDTKTCYQCYEDCTHPFLQTCDSTSKCYTKTTRTNTNRTLEARGCTQTSICESSNEDIVSCHTCDSSFCNQDVKAEDTDLGVSKCYVCINECSTPLAQHDCQEVLTAIEMRPVKAACVTYEITKEDEHTISKGCVVDDDDIKSTCLSASLFYPEVKCSWCTEDLCNGDQEPDDKFVDECYTCTGACDEVQVQNCKEVLGEDARSKCIVLEVPPGLGIDNVRGCVEVNSTIQAACDLVNQVGGTCNICDTNLCNVIEEEEEPDDKFVDECYTCTGACDEVQVQNCKEVLGEDARSKCIVLEVPPGLGIDNVRGCVEVNSTIQAACDIVNQVGGTCNICDTNLCNVVEEEEEERFVDECYSCSGRCDTLAIQKCDEALGPEVNAKCITIQTRFDDVTITNTVRGCTFVNQTVLELCSYLNLVFADSCVICDTNLCNGKEETFAEECYFCQGTCQDPMEVQQCAANSKCIATEIVQGGVTVVERRCSEVNEDVQKICDTLNQAGGNCTICGTDLCNGAAEDGGNGDGDGGDGGSGAERTYFVVYTLLLVFVKWV